MSKRQEFIRHLCPESASQPQKSGAWQPKPLTNLLSVLSDDRGVRASENLPLLSPSIRARKKLAKWSKSTFSELWKLTKVHTYFWIHPAGHRPGQPLLSRLELDQRDRTLNDNGLSKVEVCFFLVSEDPFSNQGCRDGSEGQAPSWSPSTVYMGCMHIPETLHIPAITSTFPWAAWAGEKRAVKDVSSWNSSLKLLSHPVGHSIVTWSHLAAPAWECLYLGWSALV